MSNCGIGARSFSLIVELEPVVLVQMWTVEHEPVVSRPHEVEVV